MNILYISHLTTKKSEGPNVSVPAQISAQRKVDNVFWYNLTDVKQEHWLETEVFHGIDEFPNKNLKDLPSPFSKPDLVVFESFYYFDDVKLGKECRKAGVPYIIIPRSALTRQGQNQKRYKKIPANILFFKPFTRHAAAIHYLTQAEQKDSGANWNKNSFVIPNGMNSAPKTKIWNKVSLDGIYIGRYDPYQKGLDLLISACENLRDTLEKNDVHITLYGPERLGWQEKLRNEVLKKGLDKIIFVKDGVFGEEKQKVLLDADFFLMTSRFEGHPMSMVEALSYGLPVFASRGTNMHDEVNAYKAGWTCENTVESIEQGLLQLINDRNRLSDFSKNALLLSEKYNWNVIAKKSHDEYLKIIMK